MVFYWFRKVRVKTYKTRILIRELLTTINTVSINNIFHHYIRLWRLASDLTNSLIGLALKYKITCLKSGKCEAVLLSRGGRVSGLEVRTLKKLQKNVKP